MKRQRDRSTPYQWQKLKCKTARQNSRTQRKGDEIRVVGGNLEEAVTVSESVVRPSSSKIDSRDGETWKVQKNSEKAGGETAQKLRQKSETKYSGITSKMVEKTAEAEAETIEARTYVA